MADFTKKAIRASFVKLLNEKPLKQITVKDIVDDCGVNRNTFYYHFQDIPDLIESIIREDAQRLVSEHPEFSTREECLNAIISFALESKKAILHIYRSVNRDVYERYQWKICEYSVTAYLDKALNGRKLIPEDRETVIGYLKCVSFGLVIGWLESGMQDDVHDFVHRMCALKFGELEQMLTRCHFE